MKKLLAIVLVIWMLLALCACGGESQPKEEATSSPFMAGFGKVIEGMDVVYEIENLETENEIIINKPVIKTITVDTKGVTYSSPEKLAE